MSNKLKNLTGLALAAGLAGLPVSQANAEAIASAVITFYDFQIFGATTPAGGGQVINQLDFDDFDTLVFESTADADATLQGTSETMTGATDGDSMGINFPYDPSGATSVPNPNDLCVGDCSGDLVGASNNDDEFASIDKAMIDASNGGAGTSDYAWSDQLETGAPITGLTYSDPVTGDPVDVTPNADVANSSYSKVNGGQGGANSDNGLNSQFSFDLADELDFLQVQFTVSAFAYSYLGDGEEGLASASALFELFIKPTDGNNLLWAPVIGGVYTPLITDVNDCVYAVDVAKCFIDYQFFVELGTPELFQHIAIGNKLSGGVGTTALIGLLEQYDVIPATTLTFQTTSGLSNEGDYLLDARLETSVEVELVPAPATLALFGVGMLGLAGFYRRRASL